MVSYRLKGVRITNSMKEKLEEGFEQIKRLGKVLYVDYVIEHTNDKRGSWKISIKTVVNDNLYTVVEVATDYYKVVKKALSTLKRNILHK